VDQHTFRDLRQHGAPSACGLQPLVESDSPPMTPTLQAQRRTAGNPTLEAAPGGAGGVSCRRVGERHHQAVVEPGAELRGLSCLVVGGRRLGVSPHNRRSDAYAATPAPVRGSSTTIAVLPERARSPAVVPVVELGPPSPEPVTLVAFRGTGTTSLGRASRLQRGLQRLSRVGNVGLRAKVARRGATEPAARSCEDRLAFGLPCSGACEARDCPLANRSRLRYIAPAGLRRRECREGWRSSAHPTSIHAPWATRTTRIREADHGLAQRGDRHDRG
jgi:hypothetical protein